MSNKTKTIPPIRITEPEYDDLIQAAKEMGVPLTTFVLRKLGFNATVSPKTRNSYKN